MTCGHNRIYYSVLCMFQPATQTLCAMQTLVLFAVSYIHLSCGYKYLYFIDLHRPYIVKSLWMLPLYKVLNIVLYCEYSQVNISSSPSASSQRQRDGILVLLSLHFDNTQVETVEIKTFACGI